ncbi:hypothetical protein ACTFIW_005212 [Dictyostelium discoideum]
MYSLVAKNHKVNSTFIEKEIARYNNENSNYIIKNHQLVYKLNVLIFTVNGSKSVFISGKSFSYKKFLNFNPGETNESTIHDYLDLQWYCPDKHWNKNKDLICKQHSVSKATEKCSLQGYQFAFGLIDRNLEYFSMNSFGVYGSPVQLQNEARQTNRQIKYDFEFKYDVENNKIIKYGSAESLLCTINIFSFNIIDQEKGSTYFNLISSNINSNQFADKPISPSELNQLFKCL